METLENYAMKILADAGCDCHTYGGEASKHIMRDLKEAFPEGMEYPYTYIAVANAILAISRPEPIKRSPWRVHWDTDNCCDGYDCESFKAAKESALDTLIGWAVDERSGWKSNEPTDEEKENWDYMIYNCGVAVYKYNPDTDEYEKFWHPSDEDCKSIGWVLFNEE